MKFNTMVNRKDYPLCPYCFSPCVGFSPKEGYINFATIYCSNADCKGISLGGYRDGYDIKFTDLKVIYRKEDYPKQEKII